MAPALTLALRALVTRDEYPGGQQAFQPYYIIGIVIAILLVVGLLLWLVIRRLRKKAAWRKEREERVRALNVRGLVSSNGERKGYAVTLTGDTFTRENMTEAPMLPEIGSNEAILEHYETKGKLPRPFAPFMTDGEKLLAPPSPTEERDAKRASTVSWMSMPRHSFLGALSQRASVASFASSTVSTGTGVSMPKDKRLIRQTFNPVLPDELVVSVGERFTLITSHDDGWCIVGRDSIFKPGEIEVGSIPAWCFIKPVKGLHAERPMRTSSLGVTVKFDETNSPGARDNVMSWSNF